MTEQDIRREAERLEVDADALFESVYSDLGIQAGTLPADLDLQKREEVFGMLKTMLKSIAKSNKEEKGETEVAVAEKEEMEFHVIADIFPLMPEDDLKALAADIRENGLLEPIYIFEGEILDGRNRYLACKQIGIVPEYEKYEGDDPISFVISENERRRHLTGSQRATCAVEAEELRAKFEETARKKQEAQAERGKEGGRGKQKTLMTLMSEGFRDKPKRKNEPPSREKIGKVFKVSGSYVESAKRLKKENRKKYKEVRDGDKTLTQSFSEIKNEKREKEINEIKTELEKTPTKLNAKFNTITVDPPWPYGTQYNSSTRRVASPYPEMSIEEIGAIELPCADDCILWLWTTHKFIWEAKLILDRWGFTYKAILVWNKEKMGMGEWLRFQCEFCLLGIKGKPIWDSKSERDIISDARREHSRKPQSFYDMVDRVCVGRKLDYFARETRKGWAAFGLETEKYNDVE